MSAFLTGNDVDIVVPTYDENLGKEVFSLLTDCSEGIAVVTNGSDEESLVVGKLNLIFLHPEHADAWRAVTIQLISERPVTREYAIKAIDNELFRRGLL